MKIAKNSKISKIHKNQLVKPYQSWKSWRRALRLKSFSLVNEKNGLKTTKFPSWSQSFMCYSRELLLRFFLQWHLSFGHYTIQQIRGCVAISIYGIYLFLSMHMGSILIVSWYALQKPGLSLFQQIHGVKKASFSIYTVAYFWLFPLPPYFFRQISK